MSNFIPKATNTCIGKMTDIKAKFLYKEKEQKIPRQQEMVLATVRGKRFTDLPEDLYVPPNSLKILL